MRLFRRKLPRPPELKSEQMGGHTFYYWESAAQMPTKRMLAFMQASYENSLRIAEADIDAFSRLMKEAINAGDLSRLGFLVETLTSYRSLYATEQSIFRAGNCCVLIDDEPADEFTQHHTNLKQRLVIEDGPIRDFFLSRTAALLYPDGGSRMFTAIRDYLTRAEVRMQEQIFSHLAAKSSSAPDSKE